MKRFSKFVSDHRRISIFVAVVICVCFSLYISLTALLKAESDRFEKLITQNERLVVELHSETKNSNLMGAVAILGLMEKNVKMESLNLIEPNSKGLFPTLQVVGKSYNADGVFVVDKNGIINSSWDNSGKSSTGLDVGFRPYFKTALKGTQNIYAAVSIARGDRSLYFSAPVYKENDSKSKVVGAIVARANMIRIDNLLEGKSDKVFLISPQGVVFSSNDKSYVGMLTGQVNQARIDAINGTKQFGKLLDDKKELSLTLPTAQGIYRSLNSHWAVSETNVLWNDSQGDWKLVLLEDLNRTVDPVNALLIGFGSGLLVLFSLIISVNNFNSQYRQYTASEELKEITRKQEESISMKMHLAETGVKLQRAKSIEELASLFLQETHHLFGTLQGVIYGVQETDEQVLKLLGSYACDVLPSERLEKGDGLLGQCAIELKGIKLRAGNEGLGMIRSGLGECLPECVFIEPIILNETLLGVIEVALLRDLTADEMRNFIELIMVLAYNLETVGRNSNVEAHLRAIQAAEQENLELYRFQQVLIDTIPYPIFYKDSGTRFLGVNFAYEQYFNVRREDLVGKCIVEMNLTHIPEEERLANQLEDEAILSSGESINREIQVRLPDGRVHQAIYSVSVFKKTDGNPAGIVGTYIDINEMTQIKNDLKRLLDAKSLNQMMQDRGSEYDVGDIESNHMYYSSQMLDDFCSSLGVAVAIIGIDGEIIMASNWMKVCSEFHRNHPASCLLCLESDAAMAMQLDQGAPFTCYKCANGMMDAGAPVIIDGEHKANVFVGQFHAQSPDMEFFREQAKKYDYDETQYLDAVSKAAIIEEERLSAILNFLTNYTRNIIQNISKETNNE